MGSENEYELKYVYPMNYDDFVGLQKLNEVLENEPWGKLTIDKETIYLDGKPLCRVSHISEMSIQHFPLSAHLHATIECTITYLDPREVAAKSVKDELKSRDMGLDKYSRMKRDET